MHCPLSKSQAFSNIDSVFAVLHYPKQVCLLQSWSGANAFQVGNCYNMHWVSLTLPNPTKQHTCKMLGPHELCRCRLSALLSEHLLPQQAFDTDVWCFTCFTWAILTTRAPVIMLGSFMLCCCRAAQGPMRSSGALQQPALATSYALRHDKHRQRICHHAYDLMQALSLQTCSGINEDKWNVAATCIAQHCAPTRFKCRQYIGNHPPPTTDTCCRAAQGPMSSSGTLQQHALANSYAARVDFGTGSTTAQTISNHDSKVRSFRWVLGFSLVCCFCDTEVRGLVTPEP